MKIIFEVRTGKIKNGYIKTLSRQDYILTKDKESALITDSEDRYKVRLAIRRVLSEGRRLVIEEYAKE